MKQYTEDEFQAALQAIACGMSIRQASKTWAIPNTSIRNRLRGVQARCRAHEPEQRLSGTQEAHLVTWTLIQAELGLPPTHKEVRQLAERVLRAKGDPQPLGKRWINSFLARHPSLKVQRLQRMDLQRVNGATVEKIREWWQRLEHPEVRPIKPENRWNMDEAGVIEGQGSNGLVLGSRNTKPIIKKQPGGRGWIIFIECISAAGQALPPLVIYKGKSVQQQWFPTDMAPYEGWTFTATFNGWTDNDTAFEWLKTIFLPNIIPETLGNIKLLIIDGYKSHTTPGFMAECFENNVYIVYLSAHTFHVLQPLDLTVFSTLKETYRRRLSEIG